jgi:hypothetical protein
MAQNFWSSLFGWSTESQYGIDSLFRTKNEFWGKKEPVWCDTSKPYDLYLQVPELRTVIDRRASMMANGIPYLEDAEGNIIENHWVLDLIKKPNPVQSWQDVIYSLSVNDALFSAAFAYSPELSFQQHRTIVPLPSYQIKIKPSGTLLEQISRDGLVSGYEWWYDNDKKENIETRDMLHFTTADGIHLLNPKSRIESLRYPLSNIMAQYKKRNVLLENITPLGLLSSKKQDIGGALPLDPREREQIQKDWMKRNKDGLVITESDVTFTPLTFPTRDLMLFEEIDADKMAIVDIFGMSIHLFARDSGSTFNNVQNGIKQTYQDTIIPESEQMYAAITQQFNLDEQGLALKVDFSHIHVLQEDQQQKAQALNTRADAVNKIINAGVVLTDDEKRLILDI